MKLLIDGPNMWYRCYTATQLDPPGGAMLIMANMLKKLVRTYGIRNTIIAWERGRGGRQEIDADYKAQRVAVAGVWEHLPLMQELVLNLGIGSATSEGFEADDAIGSLATQCLEDVLIVSYDKDFFQLVDDRVKVLRPGRTIAGKQIPDTIVDPAYVESDDDFLCKPEQVVILKSFRGDTSDNLPKLPLRFAGKFKETFYAILKQVDSVEAFYQKLNQFSEEHQKELLAFKDRALKTEKVAKIRTDLDVEVLRETVDVVRLNELLARVKINPEKSFKLVDWVDLQNIRVEASTTATTAEPTPKVAVQKKLF